MKMIYRRFITKSTLKNRGWSNGMIDVFYNKPTYSVQNPHYSTASPMKLYSITKVKRIERQQEFKDYVSKIAHKREVARTLMIERNRKTKELILVPHIDGMSNQRA